MENRSGFTLVELLAVIVILIIISLITIPIITKVIEDSRVGAVRTSVYGYFDAIENATEENLLDDDKTNDITTGIYGVSELKEKELKTKGDQPIEGWIQIEKGKPKDYSFKIGRYAINLDSNKKLEIKKDGTIRPRPYPIGMAIKYNPVTNAKCDSPVSTTGTKTGCMKWYVIKDNGSSVDVILDHNTTAKVAYETSGTYKEYAQASIKTQVDTDTIGWASGLNPRLITANEIAEITGKTNWNSSTALWDQYFYFGSNDSTDYENQTEEQKTKHRSFAWLFDYTVRCTNYGCDTADYSGGYGYWTSSPLSDSPISVWHVNHGGCLRNYIVYLDGHAGVRPVITLSKSIIE